MFIQSFEQFNLQEAQHDDAAAARAARRRQRRQPGRQPRLHRAVRPSVRLDGVRQPGAAGAHVRLLRDRRRPGGDRPRTPTSSRPWKRYIVSSVPIDLNPDGKTGDENGDGSGERDRPQGAAADGSDPARAPPRAEDPHLDVPRRARSVCCPTTATTRSRSTCSSTSWGSTACSRTSPGPPWPPGDMFRSRLDGNAPADGRGAVRERRRPAAHRYPRPSHRASRARKRAGVEFTPQLDNICFER